MGEIGDQLKYIKAWNNVLDILRDLVEGENPVRSACSS